MNWEDWMKELNKELKTDFNFTSIKILDLRRLVLAIRERKKQWKK